MTDPMFRIALLKGDRVIATSNDLTAVRLVATWVATRPENDNDPVFQPIIAGLREACRQVAVGGV